MFDKNGVDLNKPFLVSCMTSVSACSLAFAAHQLGIQNVPLYKVLTFVFDFAKSYIQIS